MEDEIIFNIDVMLARRKMSLTELAERVGITVANMSILKTGKARAIKVSTLAKLCAALDCQPGDLLEYRAGRRGDMIRACIAVLLVLALLGGFSPGNLLLPRNGSGIEVEAVVVPVGGGPEEYWSSMKTAPKDRWRRALRRTTRRFSRRIIPAFPAGSRAGAWSIRR
jgi:putative transcriptional regulator